MSANSPDTAAILAEAIHSRRTTRAFRPDDVPKALIIELLDAARAAPSTFNTRAWSVHALAGDAKGALSEAFTTWHGHAQ